MTEAPAPAPELAPELVVVTPFRVLALIFATGLVLSFPVSLGPFFTKLAAEQGVTVSEGTRLWFAPLFAVPMALAPSVLLGLAHGLRGKTPVVARILAGLALVVAIGSILAAVFALTEIFMPVPGGGTGVVSP